MYEAGTGNTGGDLYYAAPNPDSAAVVILETPFVETVPTVSPDGQWLAYHSDESGQNEVYVRPFPGPGGVSTVSVDGGLVLGYLSSVPNNDIITNTLVPMSKRTGQEC